MDMSIKLDSLAADIRIEPESRFRVPDLKRDGFDLPDMQHDVFGYAEARSAAEEGLAIWIVPSVHDGFYHVALFDSDVSIMEGSKRPIRRDGVLIVIDLLLAHQTRKRDAFAWISEPCEPTEYNENLYTSKKDYYRRAMGIV
jgi:hypothetical protein